MIVFKYLDQFVADADHKAIYVLALICGATRMYNLSATPEIEGGKSCYNGVDELYRLGGI